MYVHVIVFTFIPYSTKQNHLYMKKVMIAMASAVVLAGSYSFGKVADKATADVYKVNTEKSKIEWVGSKKNDYHPGTLSLKSGEVRTEGGKLVGGEFTIDINSLKVTDGAGVKLEGHLKAPDFFDAAKYPEAVFTIKTVTYTSATAADVTGVLKVKGVDVPVKFPVYVRSADEKGFFGQAFFTLDKNLLGLTYGKGMLADDVQVSVHLYGAK
jgi:polyisoprenoid-binding protein YceI